MSKPVIFLSSTCLDLSTVRNTLTTFLNGYGFTVQNSQSPSFAVRPQLHSHDACLAAIKEEADYFVMMVGGRRGGTYIGSEQSITNEEFNTALKKGIPCIVFVDKKVDAIRDIYRKNPSGDYSSVVDDKRIFHFLDSVTARTTDNWICPFDTAEDIIERLKTQFSLYLKTYSQNLRGPVPHAEENKESVTVPFPLNLDALPASKVQDDETLAHNGLRALHGVIGSINAAETPGVIKKQKLKLVWCFGRYGKFKDSALRIEVANFRQYFGSLGKAKTAFNQLEDAGVRGVLPNDPMDTDVSIFFKADRQDISVADALYDYVQALIKKYGAEEGFQFFCRGDMSLFSS